VFRIEFFCDDKKLHLALRALAGLAVGQPAVLPVVNVKKTKGGGLAQQTNGRLVEIFTEHLRKTKPATIKAADVQSFLADAGLSNKNYGYLLRQLQAARLIKKTGKGTASVYKVVLPKAAAAKAAKG